MAIISLICNLYTMLCILLVKELWQNQYFCVPLQVTLDFVSCSWAILGSFYRNLQNYITKNIQLTERTATLEFWGEVFNRILPLHISQMFFRCLPRFLLLVLNEYSTGLIIMTLAVERYILVCHPIRKEDWLNKKSRKRGYTILCVIFFLLMSSAISIPAVYLGDEFVEMN